MKNKILVVLISILLLYGCFSPKYTVAIPSDINHTDIEKSLINYIPLDDKYIMKSTILDSTYTLLKSNRFYRLENYIEHLERLKVTSSDFYLAKVFSDMASQHYVEALSVLDRIRDSEYVLLVRLLSIDLKYETERSQNNVDFATFRKQYQQLVDAYPDNLLLKRIVAVRLRYLRYNY